jgi:hypothetical protein
LPSWWIFNSFVFQRVKVWIVWIVWIVGSGGGWMWWWMDVVMDGCGGWMWCGYMGYEKLVVLLLRLGASLSLHENDQKGHHSPVLNPIIEHIVRTMVATLLCAEMV